MDFIKYNEVDDAIPTGTVMGWGATFVCISRLTANTQDILINFIQEGGFETINLRFGEVDFDKKLSGETCGDYAIDTEFAPSTMICATNVAAASARRFNLLMARVNFTNDLKK